MDSTIEVQGKHLKLSNLEKVLYPATGFTKQQVIDYYVRIAPALIPHLAGRALTRKRYPNGVDEEFFYEKNAPMHRPDWVKTAPIWSGRNRRTIHYILADDLATLVWLANLAAIELHPSLALAQRHHLSDYDGLRSRSRPTCEHCAMLPGGVVVAGDLRAFRAAKLSQDLRLEGTADLRSAQHIHQLRCHQDVCSRSGAVAGARPSRRSRFRDEAGRLRTGKVLVDWSQNDEHKTTVAVYSLRAREHPTVSTPVTWEEVERALKKKDAGLLVFDAPRAVARVEKLGDLFQPVLELKQRLPNLKGLTASAASGPEKIEIAAQAEEPKTHRASSARKTGKQSVSSKRRRKV